MRFDSNSMTAPITLKCSHSYDRVKVYSSVHQRKEMSTFYSYEYLPYYYCFVFQATALFQNGLILMLPYLAHMIVLFAASPIVDRLRKSGRISTTNVRKLCCALGLLLSFSQTLSLHLYFLLIKYCTVYNCTVYNRVSMNDLVIAGSQASCFRALRLQYCTFWAAIMLW